MLLRISALFIFVFALLPLGWLRRAARLSSFASGTNLKASAWDMEFKARERTPRPSGRDDAQADPQRSEQWQP